MPQIIMGPQGHAPTIDGSVRGKAYAFLAKLAENDALPGLNIEPIANSVDARVRTGRVDIFWRAVLFKVKGQGQDALYVYLGVWPHDAAAAFAMNARLQVNPVNGIGEMLMADQALQQPVAAVAESPVAAEPPADVVPVLVSFGITLVDIVDELGLDREVAELAMEAADAEEIRLLAEEAVNWQGVALIDLSAGKSVAFVKKSLGFGLAVLEAPVDDEDAELALALQHPAARLQFAFIEDDNELRRAIEDEDFAAWRVFLHPEQRRYVEGSWNGPFRVSGGAGTGKTVVLLHRARRLAADDPGAPILLTTFNKTLADSMQRDLKALQPDIALASRPGAPGVLVRGVDAAVRAVLQDNLHAAPEALVRVLGPRSADFGTVTAGNAWREAIKTAGQGLPDDLRTASFFQAEYATVVLPHRVRTLDDYLRVRRPGRGIALNRASRTAVWDVLSAYRFSASNHGSIDFGEAAAVAAEILNGAGVRPFRHVLVDEGQDLGPTHWQFLRALVPEAKDDLFLAEDSHQRIYGQKMILGRLGVRIVGRSQRLRLNYRTTAENLRYAVKILDGSDFVDLEEQAEDATDYRSARSGPVPTLLAAATPARELEITVEKVQEWLADSELIPETIGVLVRTQQAGEAVVLALAEAGAEASLVSDRSVPSGMPVVMTMHRAKGMEFSRVLIFGASMGSLPAPFVLKSLVPSERDDLLQKEKSLLYVAATRARDELVIVWSGEPSSLLPVVTATDSGTSS